MTTRRLAEMAGNGWTMRLLQGLSDPITRKRWRRFRARRRAYGSLWLLAILYALSLGSEVLCNDRPLYVRYQGRSFFPVFKYYPEDVFTGSGKQTRPDYRELNESPAFRDQPGHFMIFPPIARGPYESVKPESLSAEEKVMLTLSPIPHVGSVDILPDYRVSRTVSGGHFFARPEEQVAGADMTDLWPLPPVLSDAVGRRFRNEATPAVSVLLTNTVNPSIAAVVSLSAFTARQAAPRTVRLTFREPSEGGHGRQTVEFDRRLRMQAEAPPVWMELEPATREGLLDVARQAFDVPVYPSAVQAGGRKFQVRVEKNDIRWPYRPVRGHWLGIDSAGRDVLARILYGLRTSLTFGFLLVSVSMAAGISVGAVQGYYGGTIDITAQRLIEIWSALPFLYIMILMGSIYGRSFGLLLFCYGIFNWIGISYYVRAEFLRLRRLPFVDSARCMGTPDHKIIFRHILPNALTPVITLFPFSLVGAIGALAALDYLGFGLPPPTPSWGELLHQAQQFRWAWWLILYPSLALFTVMLLGVFVGEGVRDAFDPRPYSRME